MSGIANIRRSSKKSGFDVVIPDKNEKEFIEVALTLGHKEIVFLTSDPKYVKPQDNRLIVKTGYLVRDISDIQRFRQRFDYLFARAERRFFEQKVDFIIDAELSDMKDSFHYKSTSLNQVHAVLAKKNGINIVLGFNNLLNSPMKTYGWMCQNSVLINKYGLDRSAFSMAVTPSAMRSREILDALLKVLSL